MDRPKEIYKTIREAGTDEFTEKRSRFIGSALPVTTEKEALDFIAAMKSKYWDANHNVYAYILREGGVQRFSDDGEPQGTAGIPVLEVLKKVNRNNLRLKNSRGVSDAKKTKYTFQAADVLARFQSNSVESIAADSSKEELIAMYHTIFHAKPLSSFNKMRIAQMISSYIHDMNRFDALLG